MMTAGEGRRGATLALLGLLFLLALVPRLYGAQTVGWHWDAPGSFTLVNFDEGGSCRAALDGFSYTPFIGSQTILVTTALGFPPLQDTRGDPAAVKAYCHSPAHILVARSYSAVLGALTVVALALLALQLLPERPAVALTAAALLAASGFHISESQSGTVDASSVFFIYAFLTAIAWAMRRRSRPGFVLAALLMVAAIWTKYWAFVIFAWLALLPGRWWDYISRGFDAARISGFVLAVVLFLAAVTNREFPGWGIAALLIACYAIVPWKQVNPPMRALWALLPVALWLATQVDPIQTYTQGGAGGRFGSGYAAIGANKWLRNLVNVPAVLMVGLGLPACLFILPGIRAAWRNHTHRRYWLCLLPVLAFLLFMAFLAPVTYYRHYLPLLPAAALFAALGFHSTALGRKPWALALFLAWPALLAWDLVSDYHNDPRIELRQWYEGKGDVRAFATYYVNPPRRGTLLFRPEYAFDDGVVLRRADYLILSEAWYDTSFANELNGPRVSNLERLVKTRPEYAAFYRQALAGEHPLLKKEIALDLQHFMPELVLHRYFYGNFQMFVGDLKIFRVRAG